MAGKDGGKEPSIPFSGHVVRAMVVPPFPFPVVWRQKLVQLIRPGIWRLSGTRGAGDCGAIISVSG